jgi:hypothetical protein
MRGNSSAFDATTTILRWSPAKAGIDSELASFETRFQARLLFNDERKIVSPPFELHGFALRSGITYLRDNKAKRPGRRTTLPGVWHRGPGRGLYSMRRNSKG